MKAVVVTGTETVDVIDVETPVPRHGQVLIKVHTCLLCTWEQRIFSGAVCNICVFCLILCADRDHGYV